MHVGAVAVVRNPPHPSLAPIKTPSICCDATEPPDGFWRAAPVHPVSVKTQNTLSPDLHQQTGDGADGNSVCVMLPAGLLPALPDTRRTPLTCPV